MSNDLHNQIRSSIRRALYGTLGIPMLVLPAALAQQATNQTVAATSEQHVKMEKTVVTGTRLTAAEAEGSLSVTPIDVAQPSNAGFPRLGDVLRELDTQDIAEARETCIAGLRDVDGSH